MQTPVVTPMGISIHAPREGGDRIWRDGVMVTCISIHAPREGGDLYFIVILRVTS